MTPAAEALRRLVDAVCHVGTWSDGSRVGQALDDAEAVLAGDDPREQVALDVWHGNSPPTRHARGRR